MEELPIPRIWWQGRHLLIALALGLLCIISSCKSGRSQSELAFQPISGPGYTIEEIPFDPEQDIVGIDNLLWVDDLPEFDGIKRIDHVTDTHARVFYRPIPYEKIPAQYKNYSGFRHYFFYLDNTGKYRYYNNIFYDYSLNTYDIPPGGFVPDDFSSVLVNLHPGQEYKFRVFPVFIVNGGYFAGINHKVFTFRTNDAPPPPKSVYIKYTGTYYAEDSYYGPSTRYSVLASTSPQVTLRVSDYNREYASAQFYADSACTEFLGEESVRTERTYGSLSYFPFFELTLDTPLSLGEHRFYATYTNSLGNRSACSSAYASYRVVECPEDYVVVQADRKLGTDVFCVMKTEARHGANDVAVPGYSEYPWETTPQEAKDACRRIGPNCDLLTNLEWMAISKQLEMHNGNWSSGHVYDGGQLTSGNTMEETGVLNISDPEDEYDQLASSNHRYRRTFNLLMGTLWDFGGNLAEWADNAEVGGAVFQPITNTCNEGPFELLDPTFVCPELDPRYYRPFNPKDYTPDQDEYKHANAFVGRIVGPSSVDRNSATSVAAARGGQQGDPDNSGIYSLFMFNHLADTNGFRCACHLGAE